MRMLLSWRRRIVSVIPHVFICLAIWLLLTSLDAPNAITQRIVNQRSRDNVLLFNDSLRSGVNVFLTHHPQLKSEWEAPGSPQKQGSGANTAGDTDPDFMLWINEKRIDMVDRECRNEDVGDGLLRGVYIHKGTNLAYCPMAKVGCTFWKRIFLFLSNDTGPIHVNHPFQISRMFVHYGKKNKTLIIKKPITGQFLGNLARILFVRDPYSRLWSAYLDKIYLPDFWPTHALRIVYLRHNPAFNFAKTNVTRCPNDVTFEEFLEYVTRSDPRKLNEHWQPVKYRCDPCTLKPDFIGKMETFGRDAGYLLDQVGMPWVTHDLDHDALAREELNTLMEYNFSLLKHKFFRRCLSYSDIAHRLFNVFKMNGYIPWRVNAPDWFSTMTRQSAQRYREYILYIRRTIGPQEKLLLIEQRRQVFREAYKQIPLSTFERLTTIFSTDFTAFGYDTTPPHLNPNI